MPSKPDFHVALSFAGEDRGYVERVADELRRMGVSVFYDKHEAVTLWGRDLYAHLQDVYCRRARYAVVFISRHYKKKLWPNHERASAQARALRERREYILPARFDGTKIPGILGTTGYLDLEGVEPRELAEMVRQKLGPIDRPNFFPPEPDTLWRFMKARTSGQRDRATSVAVDLFQSLKLMTSRERDIVSAVVMHSCRAMLPKNLHVSLGYAARVARASADEVVAVLARIECLGFESRIRKRSSRGHLGEGPQIEISYYSRTDGRAGYDNRVLVAVLDSLAADGCRECLKLGLRKLDFSTLSSHVRGADAHKSWPGAAHKADPEPDTGPGPASHA